MSYEFESRYLANDHCAIEKNNFQMRDNNDKINNVSVLIGTGCL